MRKSLITLVGILFISMSACFLTSCATTGPKDLNNICTVFQQYPHWYWDVQEVHKRWGLPIYVTMSIIYQESHFNAAIKPPREKILWVIPWFRPSSSFGYSQALENTWRRYQRETGHTSANRDSFGDATDFIGWYTNLAHQQAGISKLDAYRIYLAYHEGIGGYTRKTYLKKKWLINVARNVQRRAWMYRSQLLRCQDTLPQKPWWHVW